MVKPAMVTDVKRKRELSYLLLIYYASKRGGLLNPQEVNKIANDFVSKKEVRVDAPSLTVEHFRHFVLRIIEDWSKLVTGRNTIEEIAEHADHGLSYTVLKSVLADTEKRIVELRRDLPHYVKELQDEFHTEVGYSELKNFMKQLYADAVEYVLYE